MCWYTSLWTAWNLSLMVSSGPIFGTTVCYYQRSSHWWYLYWYQWCTRLLPFSKSRKLDFCTFHLWCLLIRMCALQWYCVYFVKTFNDTYIFINSFTALIILVRLQEGHQIIATNSYKFWNKRMKKSRGEGEPASPCSPGKQFLK